MKQTTRRSSSKSKKPSGRRPVTAKDIERHLAGIAKSFEGREKSYGDLRNGKRDALRKIATAENALHSKLDAADRAFRDFGEEDWGADQRRLALVRVFKRVRPRFNAVTNAVLSDVRSGSKASMKEARRLIAEEVKAVERAAKEVTKRTAGSKPKTAKATKHKRPPASRRAS